MINYIDRKMCYYDNYFNTLYAWDMGYSNNNNISNGKSANLEV